MIHITVAVARFMEILFWDIARAAGLLVLVGGLAVSGLVVAGWGLSRLWRRR